MKRFAAIALALVASTALAQPGGPPNGRPPPSGGGPNGAPPNAGQPPNPSNPGQAPSAGGGRQRPTHHRPPPGGVTTLPAPANPAPGRPGRPTPPAIQPTPTPRPPMRPPFQPNPWRSPSASQWYWHGRWVNRIRGPAFVYPHGYAYVRRTYGQFLPAIFLSPRYFYDNVAILGLPRAPPGFRWVRYGPDLILVNVRTGRIEDVAYGVFFF